MDDNRIFEIIIVKNPDQKNAAKKIPVAMMKNDNGITMRFVRRK